MHHGHATTSKFFLPNNDVVSADYDVIPSCRFSHATSHMLGKGGISVSQTSIFTSKLLVFCVSFIFKFFIPPSQARSGDPDLIPGIPSWHVGPLMASRLRMSLDFPVPVSG